ncbi:MAG: hydantoinase/oxoprolinase family protein [Alphaproteobacteria bacterium]|nr:hydantoinase/oxoprolinase family protein [Alphaproteobacteria bacterium]
MRFAVDTGGTFTDLIVEDDDGTLRMYKAETTPDDPIRGVLDSLALAAKDRGLEQRALLEKGELFIHGTTHAINAVITGNTAKTAFLTTKGHGDILVFREGGRIEPFNFTVPYPDPYIPRWLTYEIPERVLYDGSVMTPLDERALADVIAAMKAEGVKAVAVCFLWSIVNPAHEERVGALIAQHMPGVPVTLSHRLNPTIREYRRASAATIDASLKPLMGAYMRNLAGRLTDAGFKGRTLVVTSQAGVIDAAHGADAPIHLLNSGPSMAPVAGRFFSRMDEASETAIVADTGGTTYDVSLVRRGRIPWTRETWIGEPFRSPLTGFPSVDVKSIGAGGGSIAWVDQGGMLHVGPKSAGAVPGPVAYGKGGTQPTVTDASLALGHLDPDFFLGGAMRLDIDGARRAIQEKVATPLGIGLEAASDAILKVATENMVQAIMSITVNQGIDPAEAVLIGGGGAAGLNSVWIARRLGCKTLVIPEVGAALSAAGALMSDLTAHYTQHHFATSDAFDYAGVNKTLAELEARCRAFIDGPGKGSTRSRIEFAVEARYPNQVWEIEVPLAGLRISDKAALDALIEGFHRAHEEIFAIRDAGSGIEAVSWSARVSCTLRDHEDATLAPGAMHGKTPSHRRAFFVETGFVDAAVKRFEALKTNERIAGPAIVESAFTTVVLPPGSVGTKRASGSLSVEVGGAG